MAAGLLDWTAEEIMKFFSKTVRRGLTESLCRGMRCCLWLLTASGVICAAGSLSAADAAAPEARYLKAYESMTLADWLKINGGMNDAASEVYEEALRLFTRLAEDFPDWQTELLEHRIDYCQAALMAPAEIERPSAAAVPGKLLSPLEQALEQGVRQEQAGDSAAALQTYREVLKKFERSPDALSGASRCLLRLGQVDEARALIREALTLPDVDAQLLALAALVECARANWTEAVDLAHRAMAKNQFTSAAHLAIGIAHAAHSRWLPAMESLKRALVADPRLADAYYNLAQISLLLNPPDLHSARVHYANARRNGTPPDARLEELLAE